MRKSIVSPRPLNKSMTIYCSTRLLPAMLARRSTEMGSPPKLKDMLCMQQCLYLPEKDSTSMQRMRRIVVKQEEKNRILKMYEMCHDGVDGMHFGRDKTYGKVCSA